MPYNPLTDILLQFTQGNLKMSVQSYVKLRKLASHNDEPIEAILENAAKQLQSSREKATVEVRLIGAGSNRTSKYWMRFSGAGAFLDTRAEGASKPTLVMIATLDAFRRMAEGSYSPVQAYLDGKVKLQGDVHVGKNIVKQLAGSGEQVDVCPTLYNESWRIAGPGYGSLTLSGKFFTPGGTVELVYNWGGGFYQQIVTADSEGSFNATESNLSCGDIPGDPGVGVIVTATDVSSGQYTTASYSTPCS
jgi:SCP-2 sterol transfer family